MLKISSLVVGLLTVISLAPSAQAFPIQGNSPDLHRRDEAVRPQLAQVILNINPQQSREQEYRHRGESDRRQAELIREREFQARSAAERHRQLELAREREVQARLAAERSRHQQYAQRHGNSHGNVRDYGNARDRRDGRSGNYYGH
jgi:membrane protein involved in colicin uptake